MRTAFQAFAYFVAVVIPYLMLTSPSGTKDHASIDYLLYFPFFGVPILILLYFSGPLSAVGMTTFATLIGTAGVIFTLGDFEKGTPFIFLIQILWLWLLFWITQKLMETKDLKVHRLQEEMEKLELNVSDYQQMRDDLEKFCGGVEDRIARYSQLQSFTDIASSLQVQEIRRQTELALQKFFGGDGQIIIRVELFPYPNQPEKNDPVADWIIKYHIPLLVDDFSQDARFSDRLSKKGSAIICPLERENAVMGTLQIESFSAQKWTEEDMRFLSDVSNIVSLALTNAVYYEKVESLAVKDSLTDLYVRYRFDERIEEEFSRCRVSGAKLSLLMLDIDHFKKVNDIWGHLVGDSVLKKVAQIIVSQTRATDFCARYGGEEMTVIMPLADVKNAYQIAERIRQMVESAEMADKKLKVTISGGVTGVSPKVGNVKELIESADRALYQAKQEGRNRIIKVES